MSRSYRYLTDYKCPEVTDIQDPLTRTRTLAHNREAALPEVCTLETVSIGDQLPIFALNTLEGDALLLPVLETLALGDEDSLLLPVLETLAHENALLFEELEFTAIGVGLPLPPEALFADRRSMITAVILSVPRPCNRESVTQDRPSEHWLIVGDRICMIQECMRSKIECSTGENGNT